MSIKFEISSYENLNKVAMTKAFREYSGLDFRGSKIMTDDLLKNGLLEFEIKDHESAKELLKLLNEANANVSTSE